MLHAKKRRVFPISVNRSSPENNPPLPPAACFSAGASYSLFCEENYKRELESARAFHRPITPLKRVQPSGRGIPSQGFPQSPSRNNIS